MAKTRPSTRSKPRRPKGPAQESEPPDIRPPATIADHLERLSFWLVASILAVRPLLTESLDSSQLFASRLGSTIGMMGPGTSLALDMAIFLAATLWLIAGAVRGRITVYRRLGWCWMALWILGAAVGALAAGNKRSALNGAADLAAQVCAFVLLVHLLRRPWQRRLILAVVLASATAVGVKCLMQWGYEYDDLLHYWKQRREQGLVAAEHSQRTLTLFEARMRAKEATGFFHHPNVCAGYLILCLPAGLGLTLGKWRSRRQPLSRAFALMGLILLVPIGAALWLTGSLGGKIGFALAVGLMIVLGLIGARLRRHRRAVIAAVLVAVVVGTAGLIGLGVRRGGMPGTSMQFRWYYWTAGWRTIQDHWITGIGRQQFGPYFLRHKPPASPDEVKNVHSAYLTSLLECGVAGAVGMIALLAWLLLRISRHRTLEQDPARPAATFPARPLRWIAAVALAMVLIRLMAAAGPEDQIAPFLLDFSLVPAAVFALATCVFLFDRNRLDRFSDSELDYVTLGAACGIVGFLVHNTISFALYEPAPAMVFFALSAICVTSTRPAGEMPPMALPKPKLLAMAGAVVCVALAVLVWAPPARAGRIMHRVSYQVGELEEAAIQRRAPKVQVSGPTLIAQLKKATRIDTLDPMPLRLLARQYLSAFRAAQSRARKLAALEWAKGAIEQAGQRDAANPAWPYRLAQVHRLRYAITNRVSDLEAACRAMAAAVDGNPTWSRFHVEYGDLLATLSQTTGRADARRAALRHYRQALMMADALPRKGEHPRLYDEERTEVKAKIRRLSRPAADSTESE